MIFGKIDYLNLLPFHVFAKKKMPSSAKNALHYKKGVPSQINTDFKMRRIDAAFISSIASKNRRCLDVGIVAYKEVQSVLVCPGEAKSDTESATSNALATLLGLKGEVVIGDKALKRYYKQEGCIDLARAWYEKYRLPFVFARLCYHKRNAFLDGIEKDFATKRIKIPQYILKEYAAKTGIEPQKILSYLEKIHYKIDTKAKKSLNIYLNLARKNSLRPFDTQNRLLLTNNAHDLIQAWARKPSNEGES